MRYLARPTIVFLLIATFYLAGFFAHALYLKKTVYGDGIYYYSWLRSVIIDHDIDFRNDYAFFGAAQQKTVTRLPGNIYAVGPAILWAPAFLWIHWIVRSDGFTLPYQISVGVTSVFFTLIGLYLLFRFLAKFFDEKTSILTTITIAFTTNLLFYGSVDTVNSHALSFFAATFFLTLLFQKEKNYFFLGIAIGLLALIRIQDAAFGILLIPYLRRRTMPLVALGGFLAFLPQLVAWQLLYHKFWVSPYLTLADYGFSLFRPHILDVLFSPHNGLILWTPIVGLSLLGLKKYPLFLLLFFIQLLVVASWTTWWQGASFSGRMFVSLLPVFSFGLAQLFNWLKKFRWTASYYILCIIAPLTATNILLIIFFLLHKSV